MYFKCRFDLAILDAPSSEAYLDACLELETASLLEEGAGDALGPSLSPDTAM